MSRAAARAAAKVPRKLRCRCSEGFDVPALRLNGCLSIIPATAPAMEMPSHLIGTWEPLKKQTKLTNIAAATPARVPIRLTPPSVPAGTSSRSGDEKLRSYALGPGPVRSDTVYAAASDSAAEVASRNTVFRRVRRERSATTTARFGQNLEGGSAPSSCSAVPNFSLAAAIAEISGNPGQSEHRDEGQRTRQVPHPHTGQSRLRLPPRRRNACAATQRARA